jgi:hypothetical protein
MKIKLIYGTSLYTISTLLFIVPAGSMASSSDISKLNFPSLGATLRQIAILFIISHNPYSIETYNCESQGRNLI